MDGSFDEVWDVPDDVDNNSVEDSHEVVSAPSKLAVCCNALRQWSTWHSILHMASILLSIFFSFSVPLAIGPFIANLVVDFGVSKSVAGSGYFVGAVSACGLVGRLLGVFFWSWLSDHVGRRPVVLVNVFSNVVLCSLLAFCPNYWLLLSLMFIQGLLTCAPLSLGKAIVSESPWISETVRPIFFSLDDIFLLGIVFTFLLGGFLGRPAGQYPSVASSPIFGPFFTAFPLCATMAVLTLLCSLHFVLCVAFLHETNANVTSAIGLPENCCCGIIPIPPPSPSAENCGMTTANQAEELGEMNACGRICRTFRAVCKKEPIVIAILYSLELWFLDVTTKALYVIGPMPREEGGLGVDNKQLGTVAGLSCLLGLLGILINPLLQRACSIVWVFRFLPLALIPLVMVLPDVRVVENDFGRSAVVIALFGPAILIHELLMTDINILMRNVTTDEHMATYIGASVSIGMIFRGLAPIAGGALTSLGAKVNIFPIDTHLPLIVASVAALAGAGLAWLLPLSLSKRAADTCHGIVEETEGESSHGESKVLDEIML